MWDAIRRLLPKSVLKQDLSSIQLTTFFRVNNWASIFFFSKCAKFDADFKTFLGFEIITFALFAGISLSSEDKTYDRQLKC